MTDANVIVLVFVNENVNADSDCDFTKWMNSWIGDLLVADYDNITLHINPTFAEYHISIPTDQMKESLSNPKLRLSIPKHVGRSKFKLIAILRPNKPWPR